MRRIFWICIAVCCAAAAGYWLHTRRAYVPPKLETLPLELYSDETASVEFHGHSMEVAFAPGSNQQAIQAVNTLTPAISLTIQNHRMFLVGYFSGGNAPPRVFGKIQLWDSIRSLKLKRYDSNEPSYPYFVVTGWFVETPFDYAVPDMNPPFLDAMKAVIRTDLKPSDFDPPLKAGVLVQHGNKYGVGDF